MTDKKFKTMLLKVLEKQSYKCRNSFRTSLKDVVDLLPKCEVSLERTDIFSQVAWNTYKTILHIRCPMDKESILDDMREEILDAARKIYSEKDQKLTDLEIGYLPEENEVIDFSDIANTDVIKCAISDAETFMNNGQYDSAFDRIHTAFHGFLRSKLDDFCVDYVQSESLSQLYSKLHGILEDNITPTEVAELVKTIIRSGSGVISSINDIRNRHSLAHPNDVIINRREAEFTLQMIKVITDYINKVC
jgi:hypothetical protein